MRFLFFLLAAALVWWLVRRLLRSSSNESFSNDTRPAPPVETTVNTIQQEVMVACAHCQVHLPHSDAVFQGEMAFCGEPHRLAYRQPPSNT